jgi:hypothetical protein
MAHFMTIGSNIINLEDISRIRPFTDLDNDDLEKEIYFLEIWLRGHGLQSIRHRCTSREELQALHEKVRQHIREHASLSDLTE